MKPGKPSSTALHIAKKLVFASEEPGMSGLVPPLAAEMSRRYVERGLHWGALQLRAYDLPPARVLTRLLERITVPGMTLHCAVRKAHLETVARKCATEGCEQIVVLGAGFDTLAQRLANETAFENLALIEVDHPATQSVKRKVLAEVPGSQDRLRVIPCDIGQEDLFSALAGCEGFSRTASTLFIAEGLLMYLEAAQVDRLLAGIRAQMAGGAWVAFTFLQPQPGGRIAIPGQSWITDAWLRWRGESFRWAIRKEDVEEYLAMRGFEFVDLIDTDRFRSLYLRPRGLGRETLADGDHLCVAWLDPLPAEPVILPEP